MGEREENVGRGLFLTFEGVDGAGKSTQVAMLVERLEAAGHEVGFGYLMANAGEVMAPHARLVAPSNDERGVLQVLDQIIAARQAL